LHILVMTTVSSMEDYNNKANASSLATKQTPESNENTEHG